MSDDLRVVYESRNRAECSDRALVLASARIPYQIVNEADSCALVVPAEFSARAMDQLIQYDDENPPLSPPRKVTIEYQNAVPGLIAYALTICGIAVLAGAAVFGVDWYAAGRVMRFTSMPSSVPQSLPVTMTSCATSTSRRVR